MNIENLVKQLEAKGVKFSVQNNELKIQAPKGIISSEVQKELSLYKPEILKLISSRDNREIKSENKNIKLDFSLIFFSSDDTVDTQNKYNLIIEASKFADRSGFSAIWTPERHFHEMGGIFPNPAIMASAIAMITKNVKLRAASVVLPLNDPVRVVENWSVADNLSNGRVEISFASGWHVNDFILAPENYVERKNLMFSEIETVRKLWRGESVTRKNGAGHSVEVKTHPRPIQKEVPVWVTAIGSPDTYKKAGEIGAHLMTCLLDQDIDELSEKLNIYIDALKANGFNVSEKKIAVFVHSYLDETIERAREKVYVPFTNYLKGTIDLLGKFSESSDVGLNPNDMSAEEQKTILDFAFNRYFQERTLMGTVESSEKIIEKLYKAGITEIACLVDFGVSFEDAMQSLERMKSLVQKYH